MDEFFFLGGMYKAEHAYCSDNNCPCPQVIIPRGKGYIFVENHNGEYYAQLTCEEGARLRNLDLEVARRDALRWWSNGMVPKRETPKSKIPLVPQRDEMGYSFAREVAKHRLEQINEILSQVKGDYLFFDTETTGKPTYYNAPYSDVSNWPRLVQLSWIVSDGENILHANDFIIKPTDFTIPYNSTLIHGISQEKALREGQIIKNTINSFLEELKEIKYVIGHNIDFDIKVIQAECYRLKLDDPFKNKIIKDTMKSSVNYCRIPGGRYGYKWPKLSELYYKLFNRNFDNAHNSMADIKATFDCYKELVKLNIM